MAGVACALAMGAAFDARFNAAHAETDTVRIAVNPGFGFLPVYVVIDSKLIEKHAAAAGLGDIKVEVVKLSGGSAQNDALLSGSIDFVSSGVPPFLILWDKTIGRGDVKALCSVASMPLFLNTRNPKIQTIADFSDADRIALAAPNVGPQAIVLQMAVAKLYGDANYKKLDPLTVAMPQGEGMAALMSGKTEITSHFTTPPFQYLELESPDIKRVLNSYDILGNPATFMMAWTTSKFRNENPKLTKAIVDALEEAVEFIDADKPGAADIYLRQTGDKISKDKLVEMLNNPDIHFTLTPQNVMKQVDFMYKTGSIKHMPTDWKELFFPEAHNLQGG